MESFADLQVSIPAELVDDYLGKLHYVSESLQDFELISDERNRVRFTLRPGSELDSSLIASRIAGVAQKMCNTYRPDSEKILCARHGTGNYQSDPHPLLEAQGDLFNYGQGRYGLGPRLVALTEFFDRELIGLIRKFSAEPHQFPSLIGADVLERCKYLRSFPHALTLVSHLREDLDSIQDFARSSRWENGHLTCNSSDLAPIKCLLSPAVCFHCYAWLQHTDQPSPRAFTAIGKCFRYESGSLSGLERLWDFTMRELIFIGSEDEVLTQRQRAIDEIVPLLDSWGLSYEIRSATDPFFIEEYATASFQLAFDLKFEVRARLPYKNKTLAVGSFNYHQDYFGRSLHIRRSRDQPVCTGCVGFGMERLTLAFLSQHGLDPHQWPEAVARELER
jgi:seryl-tRNA synthetase